MTDSGRPDLPGRPGPDRRPAWAPENDAPGWPTTPAGTTPAGAVPPPPAPGAGAPGAVPPTAPAPAPLGAPAAPSSAQLGGSLPGRRATPPPAQPTVTPRVGGSSGGYAGSAGYSGSAGYVPTSGPGAPGGSAGYTPVAGPGAPGGPTGPAAPGAGQPPHGAHVASASAGAGTPGAGAPGAGAPGADAPGAGVPASEPGAHGAHAAGPANPPTGAPGSAPSPATAAFPAAGATADPSAAQTAAFPAPGSAAPGAAAPGASAPGDGGETPDDGPDADGSKRPAWLLPVAIGGGVLVVAAVVVGIVLANRGSDSASPEPVAATTILLPAPTAEVDPVDREATTPLAASLPSTLLQYALASSAPDEEWAAQGALESYLETFTDGADTTVTVQVGQWATEEAARKVTEALAAELPTAQAAVEGTSEEVGKDDEADETMSREPRPTGEATSDRDTLPQTGAVRVDGERVGTYTAVALGDGTGVVVWRNLTVVLRVEGPAEDILDLYRSFPL